MKLEVFILGGQRIERRDGGERRERIEKVSRERIEIERKESGLRDYLCLLFSLSKERIK